MVLLISRCNASCALVGNEPMFPSCAGGLGLLVCSLSSEPCFRERSCFYPNILLKFFTEVGLDWQCKLQCFCSSTEKLDNLANILTMKKKSFISLPNSLLKLDDDTIFPSSFL